MKKLSALLLSLCLLCSVAMAETVPEMKWADIPEEAQALGNLQQIILPDMPAIIYWVPSVMKDIDVSGVENAPSVAYATEDGANTLSVYSLEITTLEDYLNSLVEGGSTVSNVTINGITAVAVTNDAKGFEGVIVQMTDHLVLFFAATPKDGDENWDAVKGVIFSSIQVAAE